LLVILFGQLPVALQPARFDLGQSIGYTAGDKKSIMETTAPVKITAKSSSTHWDLIRAILAQSGTDFRSCFHCQSCGGGCPVSHAMTYRPNGIIRLIQLGLVREALQSSDIWLCIGCNTCSMVCPQAIDIAALMDVMRHMAIEEGVTLAEPDILAFHKEVVNSIHKYGRTHKLEIMLRYKIRQLDMFSDFDVGLKMLAKRKLDLRPSKISDRKVMNRIFEACKVPPNGNGR
jgi:heterodisulfide reductase subunit C